MAAVVGFRRHYHFTPVLAACASGRGGFTAKNQAATPEQFSEHSVKARMKAKWFQRFGWFYVPVSVPGAVVCLLAALFCLTVFRAVDRHSHSVSDTLYGVFPFFVCTFLLLDWIGGRTSEKTA